jgi:hypothetical protein
MMQQLLLHHLDYHEFQEYPNLTFCGYSEKFILGKKVLLLLKKWNINARPRYIFSILVILVLDVLIASSIAWLLLNNKSCAYAAEIGYSDKVNEKPLYATTSVRSTNKVIPTTEITATSSSSSHSKSPLGAVTSSLPSIINEIKRGNKNILAMLYLSKNIRSLLPKSNIVILTDADVDGGNIFTTKNKSDKYDILVIGHQAGI